MMRRVWQAGATVFALTLLAGCGGRVPAAASLAAAPTAASPTTTSPATTTPSYGSPAYSSPSYSTPASYTQPSYGSGYGNSGYGNSGYGNTGYGSTTGMASQPLQAQIDRVKNGSLMGLGKFVVTVKVTNPAQIPQTGNLKVSILASGKSIKDFNEPVNVPAGQTITRTYEDTRWSADNASVSVTPAANSDPYAAYNNPAGTAGYGAAGPYGY